MILPVFSTNYSISKSILSLEDPAKTSPDGADSLLSIVQELELRQVVIVDQTMIGFKRAHEALSKMGVQLVFGVKFLAANNRFAEEKLRETSRHKVIVFAKNDNGCRELVKLYSEAHTKSGGFVDYQLLKERWSENLDLVFPFYDSFIHQNSLHGKQCLPDHSFTQATFFVGSHGLPFDSILRRKTLDYSANHGLNVQEMHQIYYKNKKDVEAIQAYRILSNRQNGKQQTLDKPELPHFGSDEFCIEMFLKKCK